MKGWLATKWRSMLSLALAVAGLVLIWFMIGIKTSEVVHEDYVVRTSNGYVFGKADLASVFTDIVADARTTRKSISITWFKDTALYVQSTLAPSPLPHQMEHRSDNIRAIHLKKNSPQIVERAIIEAHAAAAGLGLSKFDSGITTHGISSIVYFNYRGMLLIIVVSAVLSVTALSALVVLVKRFLLERRERKKVGCA